VCPQAISFIAALLGKQGTTQDGLPRSFAAYRRHRQQQRLKQQELVDEDEEEQDDVTDANSAIRWPVLVVCPTSVLDNWMRELNMWGTFKVCACSKAQCLIFHSLCVQAAEIVQEATPHGISTITGGVCLVVLDMLNCQCCGRMYPVLARSPSLKRLTRLRPTCCRCCRHAC